MIKVKDKYGRPFVPKGLRAPRRGGPSTKACGHIVDEGDV